MDWKYEPEWSDFNLPESIKAGQPVTADLFNDLVHNTLALKQREG